MKITGFKAVPPMTELAAHERFACVYVPYRVYLADCLDVQGGHTPGLYYYRTATDRGHRAASEGYATVGAAYRAALAFQRGLTRPGAMPLPDVVTISEKAAELEARDNVTL